MKTIRMTTMTLIPTIRKSQIPTTVVVTLTMMDADVVVVADVDVAATEKSVPIRQLQSPRKQLLSKKSELLAELVQANP